MLLWDSSPRLKGTPFPAEDPGLLSQLCDWTSCVVLGLIVFVCERKAQFSQGLWKAALL